MRGAARQGGEHWGKKREERLILDAISACLAVKLDSSHTPAVCRAPRSSFYFFFPPGCKMRQADGVVQAPPPTPCLVSTWEARRRIPALLINDIPITLWSH